MANISRKDVEDIREEVKRMDSQGLFVSLFIMLFNIVKTIYFFIKWVYYSVKSR